MGALVKDPVCGMQVDADKAAAKTVYQGKAFQFCSTDCKSAFEKDPKKYASQSASAPRKK